jgi:hypothetical protein
MLFGSKNINNTFNLPLSFTDEGNSKKVGTLRKLNIDD